MKLRQTGDDAASPGTAVAPFQKSVLFVTILASSMAFIDGTVVNIALPALQASFRATSTDLQWVVESYALLLASLLLPGGSLGDLYGRRRIFVLGVVLFAAGSACCGLASSIGILIAARGLQGVGAALLIPGSLALITVSYASADRGRAIGTWSAATAITAAVGPVLGGWLVVHASWRWVFFINLPIALAVVLVAQTRVPESRKEQTDRSLDVKGACLVTLGLGAVTFALIRAQPSSVLTWSFAALGITALVVFLMVEAASPTPLMPLSLFRSRDFAGANLLTFLLYATLSGLLFFLPLELIQVQHYPATEAGAALLPMILLIFLLSRWSGGLVARYGARLPLTVGPVITAGGYVLLLRCGLPGSYWTQLFPAIVALGVGMAIVVAPLTTTVMQAAPPEEAGTASGINNALSRIAGLLGVALFGLVLFARFNESLDKALVTLAISSSDRPVIERERLKLAGAEMPNPTLQYAVDLAFVAGFHRVAVVSAMLAAFSALSVQVIGSGRVDNRSQVVGRR